MASQEPGDSRLMLNFSRCGRVFRPRRIFSVPTFDRDRGQGEARLLLLLRRGHRLPRPLLPLPHPLLQQEQGSRKAFRKVSKGASLCLFVGDNLLCYDGVL